MPARAPHPHRLHQPGPDPNQHRNRNPNPTRSPHVAGPRCQSSTPSLRHPLTPSAHPPSANSSQAPRKIRPPSRALNCGSPQHKTPRRALNCSSGRAPFSSPKCRARLPKLQLCQLKRAPLAHSPLPPSLTASLPTRIGASSIEFRISDFEFPIPILHSAFCIQNSAFKILHSTPPPTFATIPVRRMMTCERP